MRRSRTDVPHMTPTTRRGYVIALSEVGGAYAVNVNGATHLAVLSSGRAAPALDDTVDIMYNVVSDQWRII